MGSEIVYCSVCGDRILERDFQKGRAITILKKTYCARCMVDVVKDSGPADHPAQVPKKSRTQRLPKADPLPRIRISIPFLVAIGIGVLALILLVVVLSRKAQ